LYWCIARGVVVRERGGTPIRQIFWSRDGAPVNIVGHRWNANTEAFRKITSYSLGWPSISLFSGPNCPLTRDLASKISKKIPGWHPGHPQREGATPSRTHSQHGYTPCEGAQAPPLLGPRSRKPFPQIKIYHYTSVHSVIFLQMPCKPKITRLMRQSITLHRLYCTILRRIRRGYQYAV